MPKPVELPPLELPPVGLPDNHMTWVNCQLCNRIGKGATTHERHFDRADHKLLFSTIAFVRKQIDGADQFSEFSTELLARTLCRHITRWLSQRLDPFRVRNRSGELQDRSKCPKPRPGVFRGCVNSRYDPPAMRYSLGYCPRDTGFE